MKKVLVALLIAAMLIVPMAMFASADGDDAVVTTTKGPKLDANGNSCVCMIQEENDALHSHEKCPGDPDCACVYEADAIDNFVAWLKAYIGPKVADLIYHILIALGFKVLGF